MTQTLIVDVCGTLVHENTTHGFVRAAQLGFIPRVKARAWLSGAGRRAAHVLGTDRQRQALIQCLRGTARAQLVRDAASYATTTLRAAGRQSVIARIRQAQASGSRVLLASASLDVVVDAFARAIGADGFVASRLAYDAQECCLGYLVEDATGRKLSLLERSYSPLGEFSVITDNEEDIDIMGAAVSSTFLRGADV